MITVGSRALAPGRPRLALTGSQRLVLFALILGAAGALLWLGPLRGVHRVSTVAPAPWWAFFIACYVASLLYVEVSTHHESSTLSLTEIPVALGLFLVDPPVLLGGYALGVLLANWTRRRARPDKDFANLMLDVLYMGVTVLVFNAVGPDASNPLALRSIFALALAMATAGWIVGPIALNLGSLLQQGSLRRREVMRAWRFQIVATATNTCLGIVGLLFILDRPTLAFALIPPAALVLAGQLTASESQRRADRMEFLYRTSDILHSDMQLRDRAGELLAGMTRMFAVKRTELIVMPESRGPALRFTSGGSSDVADMIVSELSYAEQEMLNALRDVRVMSGTDASDTPVSALFAERGVHRGSVASLRGRERPQGLLLLLDPSSGKSQLSKQEHNLLLTVAGHISVALENGQLADAIRAVNAEKAELTRRALYDPLTQIPNRSMFIDWANKTLSNLSTAPRPVAAFFIDLDGFKEINDTYGHAVGDQVLSAIASRLRGQVRKMDMAARFGGDEFALLLNGMRHPSDVAIVAQRVVELVRRPIPLEGRLVSVEGSVGVAMVEDPTQAPPVDELLRRADMAMYLAKRQGKGRYVLFDRSSREPVIATGAPVMQPVAGG